ncbi:hypothetical protein ACIQNU_29545 [Streptomyces sp. NPDC091292]|uniref:hypothetical protein n=1 Tax=Streptomyces sp. NPDC091292 TaxID=3365991 RepID=UPI0037FAEE46
MTEEFLTHLDEGMLAYFRDIAQEMTERFGISRAEAVARINERYGEIEISPFPDLMGHEMPEFWAYGLYYRPDARGRLPSGDAGADEDIAESALEVRPPPPTDSPAWTLPRP